MVLISSQKLGLCVVRGLLGFGLRHPSTSNSGSKLKRRQGSSQWPLSKSTAFADKTIFILNTSENKKTHKLLLSNLFEAPKFENAQSYKTEHIIYRDNFLSLIGSFSFTGTFFGSILFHINQIVKGTTSCLVELGLCV